MNKAIENVMEKNKVSELDQPFVYLWMANCILYAVVVTFLLAKNWKKNGNSQAKGRGKNKEIKRRENYDTHVKELRRKNINRESRNGEITRESQDNKEGKKEQIGTAERMPNHFGGFSSKLHGKEKV